MTFENYEIQRNIELIHNSDIFNGTTENGLYNGKASRKVLKNNIKNLYAPIREEVQKYFRENEIQWWGGKVPGNYLSSQVACINHLYPIRNDKQAVLALIRNINPLFDDVYLVPESNGLEGYISFEVVSAYQYLNEGEISRGSNCTSVDALIYAHHVDGKRYIIPIEWKHTESYGNQDKSKEDKKGRLKGNRLTGRERLNRYTTLINDSKQLKHLFSYDGSVYFYEPFYQLMRQTLWAEQIIVHSDTEALKADDYLHLHIISENNSLLKEKKYPVSGKNLSDTWKNQLNDPDKYKLMSPKQLWEPIVGIYPDLAEYLRKRYW